MNINIVRVGAEHVVFQILDALEEDMAWSVFLNDEPAIVRQSFETSPMYVESSYGLLRMVAGVNSVTIRGYVDGDQVAEKMVQFRKVNECIQVMDDEDIVYTLTNGKNVGRYVLDTLFPGELSKPKRFWLVNDTEHTIEYIDILPVLPFPTELVPYFGWTSNHETKRRRIHTGKKLKPKQRLPFYLWIGCEKLSTADLFLAIEVNATAEV